jgi:hypothetical protein
MSDVNQIFCFNFSNQKQFLGISQFFQFTDNLVNLYSNKDENNMVEFFLQETILKV